MLGDTSIVEYNGYSGSGESVKTDQNKIRYLDNYKKFYFNKNVRLTAFSNNSRVTNLRNITPIREGFNKKTFFLWNFP